MANEPDSLLRLRDVLLEDDRSGDWQARVQAAHSAAAGDPRVSLDTLTHFLSITMDPRISSDVLDEARSNTGSEAFAQGVAERARTRNWPAGLRSPASAEELGPEVDEQVLRDPQLDGIIRSIMSGDLSSFFRMIVELFQGGPDNNNGPRQPEDVATPGGNLPGNQSPEGEVLLDYIDDIIKQGNGGISIYETDPASGESTYRMRVPMEGMEAGAVASLTPEEMKTLVERKIYEDIMAGRFPVGDFPADEATALRTATRMSEHLFDEGFSKLDEHRYRMPDGTMTYNFIHNDAAGEREMRNAINAIYNDPEIDLDTNLDVGPMSRAEYATIFYNMVNLSPDGGDIRANENRLMSYFSEKIDSGEISIPQGMKTEFMNEVREAYRESMTPPDESQGIDWDNARNVFAERMYEKFEHIAHDPDARRDSAYNIPERNDLFQYGAPVSLSVGPAAGENGDRIAMQGPDEQEMLTMGTGFHIYQIAGDDPSSSSFEDVGVIDSPEKLREIFGEEFTVQFVTQKDRDFDSGNDVPVGYYIRSENGNTFHVGFDAIEESGASNEFRAARSLNGDTVAEAAPAGLDPSIVAGQATRPLPANPPPGTAI